MVSQQLLESLPTDAISLMAGMPRSTPAYSTSAARTRWGPVAACWARIDASDSRTLIDGMVVDSMFGNGQCSCVYDNEGQTQEMSIQVTGGNAENQLSGVLVNRVPRSGGNSFAGDGIFLFANDKTQGQNIDDALRARGLASGAKLYQDYDLNYSGGGPIVRDRLWVFASGRNCYNNYVAGAFKLGRSPAIDDNNMKAFGAVDVSGGSRTLHCDVRLGQQGPWSPQSGRERDAGCQRHTGAARRAHHASQVDVDDDESPAARSGVHAEL